MEERSEKAVALMKDGYNCAQAVACVFAEEAGADEAMIFRMAEGFGSGMGTMQGVCGALVGAVMLAGLSRSTAHLEHPDSKPQTAALARTLMKAFEQEAGAIYCKDLKGVATGKPLLSCQDCVRLACRLAAREVFPEKV